mmetsp:Transcript_3258/g.11841  ORF Transcript_3258/g.11841 Transcript_3258/m.11841 type:complete len:203 (-) Transcript_3258:2478-3086(-)
MPGQQVQQGVTRVAPQERKRVQEVGRGPAVELVDLALDGCLENREAIVVQQAGAAAGPLAPPPSLALRELGDFVHRGAGVDVVQEVLVGGHHVQYLVDATRLLDGVLKVLSVEPPVAPTVIARRPATTLASSVAAPGTPGPPPRLLLARCAHRGGRATLARDLDHADSAGPRGPRAWRFLSPPRPNPEGTPRRHFHEKVRFA